MKDIYKINKTNFKLQCIGIALVVGSLFSSCTDDFEEINTNPNLPAVASSETLLAGVEYNTFAEPRYVSWRGNLLFSSQFANQFTTNVTGSWWAGADFYGYNVGWTDAVFDQSYKKSGLNLRNLLINYEEIGDQNGQAMVKIMMSLFHQKMTDVFGDIPYSDVIVSSLEVEPPLYDTQSDIYRGILGDLKTQMNAIGSSTAVIDGAGGDFIYGGDPQKWKALANTLRLRMALRSRDAFIADGDQAFVDDVINDCLANTLIDITNEATLIRSRSSLINSNLDGGFEDVYWGFGESGSGSGSTWVLTDRYINLLQDNNDPRLTEIATTNSTGGYSGGFVNARSAVVWDDSSKPSEKIVGTGVDQIENQVPIMVLSAAESNFLQAEAALLGFGGTANDLYQRGILASMAFWGANPGSFLADEAIATLSGSNAEQLTQVYNQRWLASLTNGYESWALVRRTDLIPQQTDDTNFWTSEPNNGNVPKRLQYSSTELISNKSNVEEAISKQGADIMSTAVWWDVN